MKRPVKKILCIVLLMLSAAAFYLIKHQAPMLWENTLNIISPPRYARLVFAGDLMQHQPQIRAARQLGGDLNYFESFRYISPIFQQADFSMLNFETTLSPNAHYTGYPMFRSPVQLADELQSIGIDAVAMANNHVCDNGRIGLEHTIARFDSLGILHTGAFADSIQYLQNHPLRFQTRGIRFALFNYTYDTNGLPVPKGAIVNQIDTAAIIQDLDGIDRSKTDCVIVFFHWGEEYVRLPNKKQRMLSALCHQHGAEIVIGSHPHVIQPFEVFYDKDSIIRAITVYSMGNLVSNQQERYKDGGLIVTLDIKLKGKAIQITPYYTPIWVALPKYRILPPAVADTLTMPAYQKADYERFLNDTRKLLNGNELFEERITD